MSLVVLETADGDLISLSLSFMSDQHNWVKTSGAVMSHALHKLHLRVKQVAAAAAVDLLYGKMYGDVWVELMWGLRNCRECPYAILRV